MIVYILLSISIISCGGSDNNETSDKHNSLSNRVHMQMKLVQKEMDEIKNTTDPIKRKELLVTHRSNMTKLLAMYKQLQTDKSEGASGGQSALMADLMTSQIMLYESIMNDLEK